MRGETLAVETFRQTGLLGNFLALPETRERFRGEQHFPSAVIERGGDPGAGDAFSRARARVEELISGYEPPALEPALESGLMRVAEREAERAGLTTFPGVLQARE